jgi:hypothetical protein
MRVVTVTIERMQFPFQRVNTLHMLVQRRFRTQGSLFGGHTALPFALHHFNCTNKPFLQGRKIVCIYGQYQRLFLRLIRACMLFGMSRLRLRLIRACMLFGMSRLRLRLIRACMLFVPSRLRLQLIRACMRHVPSPA